MTLTPSRGETRLENPGAGSLFALGIVIPTRNEQGNVPELLQRLAALEVAGGIEVVVVDDSDDETPAIAEREASRHRRPDFAVQVLHRDPGQRAGGLSSAVVAGIGQARAPWVCVMDGDLQHPPELITSMITRAASTDAAIVVGSRFLRTGDSAGLHGRFRHVAAFGARTLTRTFFPRRLARVSDPMSGFFLVRRSAIDLGRLEPRGFKILLEILARHSLAVAEVPFAFAARRSGESKLGAGTVSALVGQLVALRLAGLRRRTGEPFRYDIHGIMGVESHKALPELEKFLSASLPEAPLLRVRGGRVREAAGETIDLTGPEPSITYRERTGFAMSVDVRGDDFEVTASSLVTRSPHVLYTNVVEPILRWRLVERGYALVHAACFQAGDDAFLVTARTDTGKTTTMLKVLDQSDHAFVSDDLVIVDREGNVLTYPKPLTISSHTVHALRDTDLGLLERLILIPQSKLHSREGRRFAYFLTRFRLPVASINAIIQILVPPPKYHVERLVRGVRTARGGRIDRMFIIQRGGSGDEPLPSHEALEILLENCADAFGFPPYTTLERMLHALSDLDLHSVEREIITAALGETPTQLMRSDHLDWAERIAEIVADRPNDRPGRQDVTVTT